MQTTLQFFVVYKLDDAVRRAEIAAITKMLEAGKLHHTVAQRFPLERIVEAHEATESGKLLGHVIVTLSSRA